MKHEDIITPEELLKFMKDYIEYGFVDSDNNIHTPLDENFDKTCYEMWKLSSPKRLLDKKYGHCWDQVEFERDWFKKNNYNFKTIFIWFCLDYENNYSTHTYLVYEEKNKWYYFEHADYANRGIYEFDNLKDAIEFQKRKHIDYNSKINDIDNNIINSIQIYEYDNPNYGCSMNEFINYILKNGRRID